MTTPKIIEVRGDTMACAHSYGEQARMIIGRAVAHYREQLEGFACNSAKLDSIVEKLLPLIEDFDTSYVAEMEAIAHGAQVPLSEIVLINARTEVLKIVSGAMPVNDSTPDGCTAVVAAAPATADGKVIHAHNWDWKMQAADASVVLRALRDDGTDFLTFTEAGALARFGVNEAGIAITGNYLECDRDYRELGVPLALIRRKVLDQTHMAMAVDAVISTRKSASNNVVLSDDSGMILDFECAPDQAFQVLADEGLLVHANHWLSAVAQAKMRCGGEKAFPCSYQRQARGIQMLRGNRGSIDVEDVRKVLLDSYGSPWSICRPRRASAFTELSATVASLIIFPETREMEIAILPADNPVFSRIPLYY